METIKVVCGIVWKEGKVFIARRKPEKSLGGYWEFPGGKIEEHEDPKIALDRELKEELGMKVKILDFFGTKIHDYGEFKVELTAYTCELISATYALSDHDHWHYEYPMNLNRVNFAPADIFIIENLLNQKQNG